MPNDVVWINDDGKFLTKQQKQQQIQSNPWKLLKSELSDFRVLNFGNTTVLFYRVANYTEMNSVLSISSYRVEETYARQKSNWQLKIYHETPIPSVPKIVTIDPRLLNDYEGRYKVGPKDIITVARVGDKLMATETNFPATEWKPEKPSIFTDGGSHIQFLRNQAGKVTGLVFYPLGEIVAAERMIP